MGLRSIWCDQNVDGRERDGLVRMDLINSGTKTVFTGMTSDMNAWNARRWMAVMGILGVIFTVGCSQPKVDNPIPIAGAEFDQIFASTIEVLREQQFVVDRQDRRFGVITTLPKQASTMIEPWRGDNSNFGQAYDATVNVNRRLVRVEMRPRERESSKDENEDDNKKQDNADSNKRTGGDVGNGQAEAGDEKDPKNDHKGGPATAPTAEYELFVRVEIQRMYRPTIPLNTSALSRRFTIGRMETEKGRVGVTWKSQGRDELMEQRLASAIVFRAVRGIQKNKKTATLPESGGGTQKNDDDTKDQGARDNLSPDKKEKSEEDKSKKSGEKSSDKGGKTGLKPEK